MKSERMVRPDGSLAPARIEVHVASAATPEPAPTPVIPSLFASDAEAQAHMDAAMRQEWDENAPEDDDGSKADYPGDWQAAHDAMAAENADREASDALWGEHRLTSHDLEIPIEAAVPRGTFDKVAKALLTVTKALRSYAELDSDAVEDIVDAIEIATASTEATSPAQQPSRQAIALSVDLGEWRALEEIIRLGLREADARAASTANDGGEARRRFRNASGLAMRISADAGRAIEAMRPEATIMIWQGREGWHFDDAENHGGFDAVSPGGPFRTKFEAEAWARAAFPFKVTLQDGRPSHYGEDAP